ncbi:DUF6415 family natural product biosynthesis protein [Streptomyces sp. NPDC058000]|uniref:DUF6415 family natural product biosynthesis protein n=1 Tax=Streptomyces sp. NPDC058000 TaxID=3346299 RepID=UPI0036EEA100
MGEIDLRFSAGELHHIPVDIETMRRTIDRAVVLRSKPLEPEELEDLVLLLRGHSNPLLPGAQAATDVLWRGSLEWSRGMGRHGTIRFHCEQSLGTDALLAHVQISQLARDFQWLLASRPAGARPTGRSDAALQFRCAR